MKKLILILAIAALSIGSLFAQTYRTQLDVRGVITGSSNVKLDVVATVTLVADSCHNHMRINNDAGVIDYSLPTAEAGLVIGFYDKAGGVITVDAASGDQITLDGTDLTAGYSIDSPGDAGDFIVHGVGVSATLNDTVYVSTAEAKPLIPKMHPTNEKPAGEWNSYDITCIGSTIELRVNGLLQNTATNCSLTRGNNGLQAEGSKIQFRNLWIEPIK